MYSPFQLANPGESRGVRALLSQLMGLVVTYECPGCGAPDLAWCRDCSAAMQRPLRPCADQAPRLDRLGGKPVLPVWTTAPYSGAVRQMILAWKDHGRVDLDRLMARCSVQAGWALAGELGAGASDVLWVVPAPSTWRATRYRGRYVVRGLAASVARGLTCAGVPAVLVTALRLHQAQGQVGHSVRGRGARMTSVMPRLGVQLRGHAVLLVDDILTSGATLAACYDAVISAGGTVVGAYVVAATPAPGFMSS